jgi:hypothetical protein
MTSERRDLHPHLPPEARHHLFASGIEHFNRGEFFAAHEAWEEIWRSTTPEPRDLFQGLIQVAVGLHHFLVLGRIAPARTTLAKGRGRLEPFGPTAPPPHGIDLAGLLDAVTRWENWLVDREGGAPPLPLIRRV